MKIIKSMLVVSALLGVLSITGCEKGPAESAGEKIDKAAEKTMDKAKDAGEAVKDAVKK